MTPDEHATDCLRITGAERQSIREWVPVDLHARIATAIREAVAAEREACARVAAGALDPLLCGRWQDLPAAIAAAIRARGQQ